MAPILLEALSSNEMYEKAGRFFDPKMLAHEREEGGSQREVRRGGANLVLAAKATVFKAALTVLAEVAGGTSKLADERRIRLVGILSDEVCDLLSSNRSSAEVQEACFQV